MCYKEKHTVVRLKIYTNLFCIMFLASMGLFEFVLQAAENYDRVKLLLES